MILYITFKDIISFFRSEKKVFIWLILCMIGGSFVLNYSYSFARYRGEIYEYNCGEEILRYKINNVSQTENCNLIIDQIIQSDLPEIKSYQFFKKSEDDFSIVGSSFISEHSSYFTGLWVEGYANVIENTGDSVCAVNANLLDYGERLKMIGEKFTLGNEEFEIKGVFENSLNSTGIVIFADKFAEKYKECDSLNITFSEHLSKEQRERFKSIAKANEKNCSVIYPPEPGTIGADVVKANELQYTAIIIMFVICLVSLIKYWQTINLPAYTVYWINGASASKIMCIAFCESLLLCVSTYLVGLGINAASRLISTFNSPLKLNDIVIGFTVFFGTFAIFTLINTAKICKEFKITNVRRD